MYSTHKLQLRTFSKHAYVVSTDSDLRWHAAGLPDFGSKPGLQSQR